MKKQGTLTIQVKYDEQGIPHMNLSSEFTGKQSIEILEKLLELLNHGVPSHHDSNLAYEYLSTPYPN